MEAIHAQAICGFGVGSSTLLKIKLQGVFKALNVDAVVTNGDVTSASSVKCDVIFTSEELAEILTKKVTVPVIVINNFIDVNEMKEKIAAFLESK